MILPYICFSSTRFIFLLFECCFLLQSTTYKMRNPFKTTLFHTTSLMIWGAWHLTVFSGLCCILYCRSGGTERCFGRAGSLCVSEVERARQQARWVTLEEQTLDLFLVPRYDDPDKSQWSHTAFFLRIPSQPVLRVKLFYGLTRVRSPLHIWDLCWAAAGEFWMRQMIAMKWRKVW